MQVASLVSADRLVLGERKITQRDTSLDNPSADVRRFADLASAIGTLSQASFSLPPLHGHAVALENNGPNGALDIVPYFTPPSLPPRPPFPLESNGRTTDRLSLILRFPCVLFAVLLEIERAFSAYGRELHFTSLRAAV